MSNTRRKDGRILAPAGEVASERPAATTVPPCAGEFAETRYAKGMRTDGRRWFRTLAGVLAIVGASISAVHAQRIWSGFAGRTPPKFPTATTFEGSFHFCRVMFTSDRREKQGWATDYPGADLNFSIRLSELTKVRVKMTHDGEEVVPDAVVVSLTDDALFQCPFTLMEDAGTAQLYGCRSDAAAPVSVEGRVPARVGLSRHLGPGAVRRGNRPGATAREFPIVDLSPPDHPMWHTMFQITQLPQMASINTWRRTGGGTIERWNTDGAPPDARGIADTKGRLMVVMIHNTDLPDPWEREAESPEYFFKFSPDAYAVGIDIVLYALTH